MVLLTQSQLWWCPGGDTSGMVLAAYASHDATFAQDIAASVPILGHLGSTLYPGNTGWLSWFAMAMVEGHPTVLLDPTRHQVRGEAHSHWVPWKRGSRGTKESPLLPGFSSFLRKHQGVKGLTPAAMGCPKVLPAAAPGVRGFTPSFPPRAHFGVWGSSPGGPQSILPSWC